MRVNELNPGNEALTQLREHWQKVLMMVMKKHGIKETTLDLPDMQWMIDASQRGDTPILVTLGRKQHGPDGGFTLILCDNAAAAMEIVAKYQGTG